jgi:hypothetical protein
MNIDVQNGSHDRSTADNDQQYTFGFRPTLKHPFPFNTIQYGNLLVMRSKAQDGEFADDRQAGDASMPAPAPRSSGFLDKLPCGHFVVSGQDKCPICWRIDIANPFIGMGGDAT